MAAFERPDEAHQRARESLLSGDDFKVWEDHVRVEDLRVIYRRRERHTRQKGLATVGFEVAVADLEATPFSVLRIGQVTGRAPSRHFQLFLAPNVTEVVACLAVPE